MKALVAFIILSVAVVMAWAVQGRDSHVFDNRCFDCHVGSKDPAILTRDADFLCVSCHPEQKKMTHPSGIVPRRSIPPDFPLYNGKMLCITCHIAHKTYDANDSRHKQFDNNPYFLRFAVTGKAFCYQCHDGGTRGFSVNEADSHALGFGKAHTLSHDVSLKEILDDGSRECLSCHDGTLSSDASVRTSGVNWEHSGGIGVVHPIGINYSRVYSKKPQVYHHLSAIDSRIKFFNGKIGCQTCHTHYSAFPHLLVMDNKRSRLCLQCHNL